MRSKLTKTIFTIVFVVFLGLIKVSDVNAGGDMSCYYEIEDEASIIVTISAGMSSATADITDPVLNYEAEGVPILNWSKGDVEYEYEGIKYKELKRDDNGEVVDYNGYDDVWKNVQCPSNVIYARVQGGGILSSETFLMVSDSYNAIPIAIYVEKIAYAKKYIFERDYHVVGAIPLTGAIGVDVVVDDDIAEEAAPITISPHECECNYISSHPRIYTDFVIGEKNSLDAPSVHLVYGSDDGNYKVENWSRAIGNTNYTALSDVAKNNTCPAYLLYARVPTWKDHVYLSDEANMDYVKSSVAQKHDISTDDVYDIACNKKVENTRPDLGNIKFERPEYDNPSINPNIVKPLTPNSGTVSCGDGYMEDIPTSIVKITSIIYILLQIIVPIALVIMGSMDLVKAVMAQKEDEIKKGQQVFVKRLIVAVIVFFVFAFIKLVVGIVSREDAKIIGCMNCFLNGENSCD